MISGAVDDASCANFLADCHARRSCGEDVSGEFFENPTIQDFVFESDIFSLIAVILIEVVVTRLRSSTQR